MSRKTIQRMKVTRKPREDVLKGGKRKYPFHIFRQLGNNKIVWERVGSVRLGRALRAAREMARFSSHQFFVALAIQVEGPHDGTFVMVPDPQERRYYASHKYQPWKRKERQPQPEVLNAQGESLNDVMVDMYRERLARTGSDAVD